MSVIRFHGDGLFLYRTRRKFWRLQVQVILLCLTFSIFYAKMRARPQWAKRMEAYQMAAKYFGELVLRDRLSTEFMNVVGITADPFNDKDGFLKDCNDHNPRFNNCGPEIRYLYGKKRAEWATGFSSATMNLATTYHMVRGENPLTGVFDCVLALGGARWSPLDRLCHIINRMREGKAHAKKIVIAGSTRLLGPGEKELAFYAPDPEVTDEFGLCAGAREYVLNRYPDLQIVAVRKDDKRSGNDGVIDQVMEEIGGGKGLRIGAVTTQIYQAGLALDMARAQRRHGWLDFEAAGHCSTPWLEFDRNDDVYFIECLVLLYKACQAFHAGC